MVATTITPGDRKAIGQLVNLHPALVDTPLGCRVVEADRWPDTFTLPRDGRPARSVEVAQLGADREAMWQWLKLADLAELVGQLQSRVRACPVDEVRKAVTKRQLELPRFSPALTQAIDAFVRDRAAADGAATTGMLELVRVCTAPGADGLADCLCRKLAAGLPEHYWFPEDHTSQIREREAALSPTLAWLRPSADRMGHIDFWTHTTFSLRDRSERAGDESRTAALNFPPAQLAVLRGAVAQQLPDHLKQRMRSPNYDDFMRPLEEFVLAQRLTRAALAGRLGPDFPLSKLLDLEAQTRRFVATQPTVRWEPVTETKEQAQTQTQPRAKAQALYDFLGSADAGAAKRHKAYVDDQTRRQRERLPVCAAASG